VGYAKSLCSVLKRLTLLSPFVFQTEIAKRLNAILAQIMPFLSQEVSEPHIPTRPVTASTQGSFCQGLSIPYALIGFQTRHGEEFSWVTL
jgi:hypothetical protein